jgi:Putative transposase/Transposase zinc-binding domain
MPVLELADIFRLHGSAYRAACGEALSGGQRKALRDLAVCRTATLGGYVAQCDRCDHRVIAYRSCRNRHCPKCQAAARAAWLKQRATQLLPVEYFHVVFTLPQAIAPLALQNQRTIYNILFRAAAETLLRIAADPKHLGAQSGFLAVLHTWGQNLQHHPHLHCIVPGGGIAPDRSRWIACRPQFFLPVRVLSRFFRNKFVAYVKQAFLRGDLSFHGKLEPLGAKNNFINWVSTVARSEWVVYAKPPFGGPQQVLKYLARYTYRVAIANRRLLGLHNGQVTFRWKDYAQAGKSQTMTLAVNEFIRRFLLHVLPGGFVKIRHFGFLANRGRRDNLALCRQLLEAKPQLPASRENSAPKQPEAQSCPLCKVGRMSLIELLLPRASASAQPYPAVIAVTIENTS